MKSFLEEIVKNYISGNHDKAFDLFVKYITNIRDQDKENPIHALEAVRIAKSDLGYYLGYQEHGLRAKMEEYFNCEHPIFGSVKEMGFPTPEEAFHCGINMCTLKELRERGLGKKTIKINFPKSNK